MFCKKAKSPAKRPVIIPIAEILVPKTLLIIFINKAITPITAITAKATKVNGLAAKTAFITNDAPATNKAHVLSITN